MIAYVLSSEKYFLHEDELKKGDFCCFKYAPLSSVDVLRSFRMNKSLLIETRQSFKLENL